MNSTQAPLPFDTPVSLVEQAFLRYIETPHSRELEAEIVSRARRLKASGWKSYGIAAIFEAIRFDRSVALGPDEDGYKCNNNHKPFMARRIMAEYADLAGFFDLRAQYGRAWRKRRVA